MMLSANQLNEIIPPSPWVECHLHQIEVGREVLDLACGSGRHTRLLVEHSYPVLAVDRNTEALAGLSEVPGVRAMMCDLEGESWPLLGEQFAGIVVTNYLWRPRFADLLALLAPGGVLIYETFMLGNEAYGKPSSPNFLLRPGELRELISQAGLCEISFEEGFAAIPKPCMRQAICARRA